METALKTTGWTLLDFEGKTLAEGLPSWQAAVVEILNDDDDRFEIRPEEGLGWRLWVTNRRFPLGKSVFFSLKDDEDEATAEIFAAVAKQAARDWNGYGKTYRILTDADHAAELVEDDEDDDGEAWFAFYPFGRRGDAWYGWGTRDEAERYQAFENRGRDIDTDDWILMDRGDDEEGEAGDGINLNDFFASNPDARAA